MINTDPLLSVVMPVYNERTTIDAIVRRVLALALRIELIDLIVRNKADVVYGSRFLGRHRAFMFSHYLGTRLLTLATNVPTTRR